MMGIIDMQKKMPVPAVAKGFTNRPRHNSSFSKIQIEEVFRIGTLYEETFQCFLKATVVILSQIKTSQPLSNDLFFR